MKVKKWNYTTSTYNECEIAYSIDKDTQETVTCACCGKQISIKVAYQSRELQCTDGTILPVCPDCYDLECIRRQIHYGCYY